MRDIAEQDVVVAVEDLNHKVVVGCKGKVYKVGGLDRNRYVVEFTNKENEKVFLSDVTEKEIRLYGDA